MNDKKLIICSFCEKNQYEVRKLIAGTKETYICEECTELCNDIMLENFDDSWGDLILPTPLEINEVLDEYIIHQNKAKKILSVAIYNHYKRLKNIYINRYDFDEDLRINKSNILLIGPSGSGKTLLAETLARIINVPFTIADATTLTEAGYVGDDVENIIQKLLHRSNYVVERAEKGIVYIDEIDKICKKSESPTITRDVSGEGVQQALLKLIEGTIAAIPPIGIRRHPQQDLLHVDTADILFICGGTFIGLDKIISQRLNKSGIGFSAKLKDEEMELEILNYIEPDDLVKFGLIPEFIGRLPVISVLNELDELALTEILNRPRNSLIRQYIQLFKLDNIDLEFDCESVKNIANKSKTRSTGARGLRSILEETLLETMYDTPTIKNNIKKILIDKEVIENKSDPIIIYKEIKRKYNY